MRKFLAALALLGASLFTGAYLIAAAQASRNSTGTYSLAQPPFIGHTTISSGTMNALFSDLATALTDSLSRSGTGGMLAPLGLTDGTVTSPSLKFNNEAGTGLYRAGAGDLRAAIAGLDVAQWNAGAYRTGDGTLAAPAQSYISETGTGWYKAGASNPALSVVGTKRLECTTTGCIVTGTLSVTGTFAATGSTLTAANSKWLLDDGTTLGSGFAGIWGATAAAAPSTTNYSYASNGTSTNVNGATNVSLTIGNVVKAGATSAGFAIGASGTAISGSFRGVSASNPFPLQGAQTCQTITITVTGAAAGAECAVGIPGTGTPLLSITCAITATDTCKVTSCNPTAGNQTPNLGTYSCRAFNP